MWTPLGFEPLRFSLRARRRIKTCDHRGDEESTIDRLKERLSKQRDPLSGELFLELWFKEEGQKSPDIDEKIDHNAKAIDPYPAAENLVHLVRKVVKRN